MKAYQASGVAKSAGVYD
jgi:hypothetical protein